MSSDSDKEGMLQRKNDLDEGGRKVSIMYIHMYVCMYVVNVLAVYIIVYIYVINVPSEYKLLFLLITNRLQ